MNIYLYIRPALGMAGAMLVMSLIALILYAIVSLLIL